MWNWLSQNTDVLSLAVSMAMLVVWIVYLQLLLNGYRRQRRSSILISRGAGHGIRSRCLITSMSAEPLYVTSIIATLETEAKSYEYALTDLRDLPEDLGADPRSSMRQGSLSAGEYLDIGHFDEFVSQLVETDPDRARLHNWTDAVNAIELTVLALYGSDRLPVGASRRFSFVRAEAGGMRISPDTLWTRQLHSRRQRKQLVRKLASHL
ncbi:hypothetical protein [Aurantimonas marianensis]|uniref:Uncharacterized protein n=1 Tax=Aurantimonas marianensis TaxID=2920428 RepID=A0A9X2H957_9HYPH|nr:hypothetical protein [Aurantimonas marianensis]MCP3054062.1 hypothetical protein [Aurantimonas marianensis]